MMTNIVILAFVLLSSSTLCSAAPPTSRSHVAPKDVFGGPQIYLTVSPLADYRTENGNTILLDRMLEIHWQGFGNLANDSVAIYVEDPAHLDSLKLKFNALEEHPVEETSGDVLTSVRYERSTLSPSSPRCVGFWAAYLQAEENGGDERHLVKSECLQIHPTWMNDIKSQIGKTPLHSLMIPGTHNAGSWIYYEGPSSEGRLVEYTYCHEDSIYDQLIHGIRSLDVRVGHYPLTNEKFFINHDQIVIRPLRTLLEDVKKFVLETNEIVLLDFHRFPAGFGNANNHHKLAEFIQEQIGDILAPKSLSLSVTPEELWEINRPVLLFYSEENIEPEYEFLWPGVAQAWGDKNKLEDLEAYFNSAIPEFGCRGIAWSAMAQLTSTVEDVIIRPKFGVRGYANISNNEVSKWYQRESWYSKSMIVALDYYRSTNVIETAIEVNKNMLNVCT